MDTDKILTLYKPGTKINGYAINGKGKYEYIIAQLTNLAEEPIIVTLSYGIYAPLKTMHSGIKTRTLSHFAAHLAYLQYNNIDITPMPCDNERSYRTACKCYSQFTDKNFERIKVDAERMLLLDDFKKRVFAGEQIALWSLVYFRNAEHDKQYDFLSAPASIYYKMLSGPDCEVGMHGKKTGYRTRMIDGNEYQLMYGPTCWCTVYEEYKEYKATGKLPDNYPLLQEMRLYLPMTLNLPETA